MKRSPATILVAIALAACGGPSEPASGDALVIAINAPFSTSPYIGQVIERGVRLAVDEINASGGVRTRGRTFRFAIRKLDSGLSPQRALENVRRAAANRVFAVVDEGTGVDASWPVANDAGIPLGIVWQGGIGLVDAEARPNVFRIAPTDRGMSFRLAEYLIPKGLEVALLRDDSDYGQQGRAALERAFGSNPEAVAAEISVPVDATDPAPQVVQARQSGATALLVWAQPSTIAKLLRSARSAGWDVPVFTPAAGQDPLIRQQLSDHPEWVDGLTFASGRMTAERGPEPFLAFQRAYQDAFGPDEVGVTTSSGQPVIQPPEFAMYPYDFVKVLAAALEAAGGPEPAAILDALNQVDVRGANGDERGFNEKNHEGVVDDDVYFAVFHDMTYAPVQDDPLSSTLDAIDQTP